MRSVARNGVTTTIRAVVTHADGTVEDLGVIHCSRTGGGLWGWVRALLKRMFGG